MIQWIVRTESVFEEACLTTGRYLQLAGATIMAIGSVRRRWTEVIHQTFRASYGSLPVTLMTAMFSGMILAFQTGIELQRYGQESSIGFVVAASMCREMGPVMTAIALAGLMGSSYAAELGTMRVSEEIDALEVMSIDPVRYLVMPRVVALVSASVALTLIVDAVGIMGGAMIGKANFNVSMDVYFTKAQDILELKDIWQGLVKAALFSISTAVIGCSEGMNSGHGAEGVGKATQKTVVLSFIFVLIIDHIVNFAMNLIDASTASL